MEQFYEQLDKHIKSMNTRFREKFSIKQTLYDDILLVLRDGWEDAQMKFWVFKKFKLVTIGDQNIVYEKKSNLPVITNHNKIRSEAEASYMATIAKRQKLFNDAQNKNNYKIGDLVRLKIDRVDRTNVTPKVLPCKIISITSTSNSVNTYELCTTTCIISSWFQAIDLLNLIKCNFRDLRDVDPTGLPVMTFIQACKEYVKINLVTPTKACNYNGNCSTNKCCCRAAKVPCSTKCHSMKPKSCLNM